MKELEVKVKNLTEDKQRLIKENEELKLNLEFFDVAERRVKRSPKSFHISSQIKPDIPANPLKKKPSAHSVNEMDKNSQDMDKYEPSIPGDENLRENNQETISQKIKGRIHFKPKRSKRML